MNFAIIGCGRISKNHVDALANNKDTCNLVAVCDIVLSRAIDRKNQYENVVDSRVSVYTDYLKMLDEELVDCVAICTESGYHADIAIDCLNAGKHILIEKPMAMSIDDAKSVINLAKAKNLKVGVCHQNRFNPPIQKLRRAIEEGRFGKLVNVTARILWSRDDKYYAQASWRGTKALDGGTLMNQCIHNIDLMQWMVGSEVEGVWCERGTFLRDIEMEDFGALLIRFKNNTIGIVEGSACVYPRNLEETLSVFRENGTVVIGGLAVNKIQTWQFADERDYDHDDIDSDVDSVYGNGHTPLYKDYANAVLNNTEPYINGEEGIKALSIILAAYNQKEYSYD